MTELNKTNVNTTIRNVKRIRNLYYNQKTKYKIVDQIPEEFKEDKENTVLCDIVIIY